MSDAFEPSVSDRPQGEEFTEPESQDGAEALDDDVVSDDDIGSDGLIDYPPDRPWGAGTVGFTAQEQLMGESFAERDRRHEPEMASPADLAGPNSPAEHNRGEGPPIEDPPQGQIGQLIDAHHGARSDLEFGPHESLDDDEAQLFATELPGSDLGPEHDALHIETTPYPIAPQAYTRSPRMTKSIGVIIGSLSEDSINRTVMRAIMTLSSDVTSDTPSDAAWEFHEISIGSLPLYSYDYDGAYPAEAIECKEAIRRSDGIIIATPEYNRSIPGALKNAIDWASRPYGDNAFAGIPIGIIGASPGAPGTAMAQQHLRNIMAYLDAPCLNQPEAYIQFTDDRFDENGTVTDDSTREFLLTWIDAFRTWVDRIS